MRYNTFFKPERRTMLTSKRFVWLAWMIASFFYAYQYILRVMPSIMMTDITHQFHIDAAVFGQFSGIYYIGYSLMHLPIGIMLDRFGPRKVMTGCILLTVIGLLPILFTDNWIYPVIGRSLIGVGSSAAILGTFKIIRMTFQEKYFSRMLSVSVTIGLMGAIYGGGPVGMMCHHLGYQTVIAIIIAIGVLLACITYCLVPDIKADRHTTVLSNIRAVLSNRRVILMCFFSGLMVGPLEGFSDIWGPEFLKQVYGFSTETANYLPSMIFMGMCFGAPLLSVLAEKTGYYLGTIIASGIVMLLIFTALVAGMLTVSSITVGFILVGIGCAYQILAIYKASTYVPDHLTGLTTAVANMVIMSFGYAFHAAIGFIIHSYGGIHVQYAFVYGISVIPVTLGIGVAGFIYVALRDALMIPESLIYQ